MNGGIVFDIKEFTVHDGPGIRTTVFLKGCPLRCLWCHNPEGLSPHPQIMIAENGCTHCGACLKPCAHEDCHGFDRCLKACPQGLVKLTGERILAEALAKRLKKMAPMLVDGGITISGGEPLMQPEFTLELLERLRPMDTVVETSGYAPPEVFQSVARVCSTLYLDIKHTDSDTHRKLTGVDNAKILTNLEWIKSQGLPFLVRVPLIPGLNDDESNLTRTAELLEGARGLIGVEFLPYNRLAGAKYKPLGLDYPLKGMECASGVLPIQAHAFERRGIPFSVL